MKWYEHLLLVVLLTVGVSNFALFFVGKNPYDPMSLVAAALALLFAWIYPDLIRRL